VKAHQQLRQHADEQAKRLRLELRHLTCTRAHADLVKALSAQSGVGWFSAIRLIIELGEIDRFPTTDSLPNYLGLTPSQYSSGELDHRGHILKCGPGFLRAMLLQCGWSAIRQGVDIELRDCFDRLVPKLGRKRAIVAVTRRLAIKLRRRWREAALPSAASQTAPA
jgi:transposase